MSMNSSFHTPPSNLPFSLLSRKCHILVFIFSLIIGIGIGVALNNSFLLTGGPLMISRDFNKNQALQYIRVLSSCFGNSSNYSNNSSITNEQCNVDHMVITFYVKNSSEAGYFLIAHIDDHYNELMNSSSVNSSLSHDFSFEKNSEYHPINSLFYINLNSNGQFLSLKADKNVEDNTITLVKQAIIQFTPKLDRYLFQNPKETSHSDYIEENPQGYVIPTHKISSENDSFITLQKTYNEKSFIKGNGFENRRSTINYDEKNHFNKEKGRLESSEIAQNYKHSANEENDLLNTDFTIKSISNFKLITHKNYDYDASDELFNQESLASSSRKLFELRSFHKLYDYFKGNTDKSIQDFADNLEIHKSRFLSQNPERSLENETPIGLPCIIRLFPAPKSLFNYDLDLYVEMKLTKGEYSQIEAINVPSLNPNRSYLNAEYSLKLDIYKETPLKLLKSVVLFNGNLKINSTLLDILPYFESFQENFFEILETLDDKTKEFVKKTNEFLQDLRWDKKLLFQYTYNLAWIASITFEAHAIFDIHLETALNIQQLYDNNKKALSDFYEIITNSIDKNAKAWIPSNIAFTKIKWTNLTNETIEAANSFKKSWAEYVKALNGIRNQLNSSLSLNMTSSFSCHGNLNFEIKIKVNIVFINVGVKINGTFVGFQTDALFYIDLLNLAGDRERPGKYFGVSLSVSLYMFAFKFWIYYEVSDCDWFEKVFNFMVNSRKTDTRLLNYRENYKEKFLENMVNSEVKVYRNLEYSSWFSSVCNPVNNAVTNGIKTITNDVIQVAKAVVLGGNASIQAIDKVVSDAFDVIKTFIMKIIDKIITFEELFHIQELKNIYQDFGGAGCGVLPGDKKEEAYAISNPVDVMYYQINLTVNRWEVSYGMALQAFSDNAIKPKT